MEVVELVLAEPAALLVAKRSGDLVALQPGSDARQVVLVDERQTIGLQGAAKVDCDDSVEFIFPDVIHQDGQGAVVLVTVEAE